MEKQAFLIVTQEISKHVLKLYNKIKAAVPNPEDVILLFHARGSALPNVPEGVRVETFTNDVMKNLGYKPIRTKLVPGSNHFPVLEFFLKNPQYQYYWCIEDDVTFSGEWSHFFNSVNKYDYDFVTSHIRRYTDLPDWFWWDTYRVPGKDFDTDMINSFNPAYRISNRALKFIDLSLKNGYRGHHEVLLPTLLRSGGYTLADLGSDENHVTPCLSLCTLGTMRWKPVFFRPGPKKNHLYHPVKANINYNQFMEYIRRNLSKKTDYLT